MIFFLFVLLESITCLPNPLCCWLVYMERTHVGFLSPIFKNVWHMVNRYWREKWLKRQNMFWVYTFNKLSLQAKGCEMKSIAMFMKLKTKRQYNMNYQDEQMKVLWLWGPSLVHVGDPKCGRFGRTSKCCLDWLVDNRCVDEPKCMVRP